MKADIKISTISESTFVKGELVSEGEIHLSGTLEGDVNAKTLYVAKTGKLHGSITVDNLTVNGHIEGNVIAEKAFFKKTARLQGEIKYRILVVEEGAEIVGKLQKIDSDFESAFKPLKSDEDSSKNLVFVNKK